MKQAVILAAGEGQRLRPFTATKPKAMLSIAGRPIIRYVIESLVSNGIREIILVVGYKQEQILDYVGEGEQFGANVKCINQSQRLGTAHALAQARGATDEEFLVLPGDKLIARETLTQLVETKPPAMLIKRNDNPSRYGVVTIANDTITSITEKPSHPESYTVNTGIYAFSRGIFDYIGDKLDIPDVLNDLLAGGKLIAAVETNHTWLDVVYPWDMLSLNAIILQRLIPSSGGIVQRGVSLEGLVSIGKGTVVHSNSYIAGPVVIGEGCEIGPNVCIFPATSIANNVVVSPFCEVRNSIIGDDVHIASGAIIQDSVIDKGCVIGAHFSACSDTAGVEIDSEHHVVRVGAMLGEGCHLGSNVVAQPGVIAGNYSQVKSLKIISGRLPDRSLVL